MKFGTSHVKDITAALILEHVSEFDIFKQYITALEKPNTPFCSELRKDHNPTCRVSNLTSGWIYKDFGSGDKYTCFTYVMEKYGLSYPETLRVIATDFNIIQGKHKKLTAIIPKELIIGSEPKEMADIKIVSTSWHYTYLEYWKQYNIYRDTLDKYNVKPIKGYYINGQYIQTKDMSFAYCFGNHRYKILRPNNEYKWMSNTGDVIQGLAQLKPGGLLFITSSLKDVMTLDSIGYKAVAPQSETALIPEAVMKKFKKHFDEVVVYYNNDAPGIKASIEHSEVYKVHYIVNSEGDPKDPSDFVKEYNPDKLKQLLKHYGF